MEDELRQHLRELVEDADALGAAVVPATAPNAAGASEPEPGSAPALVPEPESGSAPALVPEPEPASEPARASEIEPAPVAAGAKDAAALLRPLGMGATLRVWFAPEDRRALATSGAALERGVRALRACFRRWQAQSWPALLVLASPETASERVIERIESFLTALAGIHNAAGTVLTLRGRVMARSGPIEPLDEAQIPFLLARVDHETRRSRGETSHIEIFSDSMYVLSFWYGACLLAFFHGPYSLDFFRHRARMVARELALLLPLLDDPPPSVAKRSPRPE